MNDSHIYYEHIRSETKEVIDYFYLEKDSIGPIFSASTSSVLK